MRPPSAARLEASGAWRCLSRRSESDPGPRAGRRAICGDRLAESLQCTRTPLVCPITQGGNFARHAGFAVPLSGAGTATQGVVLCNQIRGQDRDRHLNHFVPVGMHQVHIGAARTSIAHGSTHNVRGGCDSSRLGRRKPLKYRGDPTGRSRATLPAWPSQIAGRQ